MEIGKAVRALKDGNKVARKGWNPKGMYLWIAKDFTLSNSPEFLPIQDTVFLRSAGNNLVAWNACQTDLLATDWEIVE